LRIPPSKANSSTVAARHADAATTRPAARQGSRRWLLFVHQLPSTPSNLRVKTWRRMQQLGAIAIKQAVYVLPDSSGSREDFEWLKTQVEGAGGEASVFVADTVDAWSDDQLVEEFRRSRQEAYAALANEIEPLLRPQTAKRSRRGARANASQRLLDTLRQRFTALEAVDFFGSAGRDRVVTLLQQLEAQLAGPAQSGASDARDAQQKKEAYQQRLWVTRPRPGVDRMSSAWLIRRFIDPRARFAFAADREAVPRDGVPFDMFGVELTHQGEHCTFETLCHVFNLDQSAVARLAALVHDLDLKDGKFGAPEAASIGAVIDGLQLTYADDDELLGQGITLFEALYRTFDQSARRSGPTPVVTRKGKSARPDPTTWRPRRGPGRASRAAPR
jgi:hypothetical protein